MDCPRCKDPLIVLELHDVEVDYCAACKGVWLDSGELELLFDDREMTRGFLTAGNQVSLRNEKPIRCPICRIRMRKEVTGGVQAVTYDVCPQGDGIWFDQGELQSVLAHGSTAPGGDEVAHLLQDMLGGTR